MFMSSQFLRGMPKYTATMQTFAEIKDSVTLGGIVAMFGWVEGISDSLSQRFDMDVDTMLSCFRADLGLPRLPLIMGRYEENADTTIQPLFYAYKNRIIDKIDFLQLKDSFQHRIMLTPFMPLPKTMYFDAHHYNAEGYAVWANTAAEILNSSNWNTWSPQKNAPLKLLFPRGGECFTPADRIPITWMCDPESLSVIFIRVSQDSGKTWSLISGEEALYPWIKTFYWTPNESGLTFADNASLMIEIRDYNETYACRSNPFSLGLTTNRFRVARPEQKAPSAVIIKTNRTAIKVTITARNYERVLRIYSPQGRCLVQGTIKKAADFCEMPLANLTHGAYILTISSPDELLPGQAIPFIARK
jgi:hypothetical protein